MDTVNTILKLIKDFSVYILSLIAIAAVSGCSDDDPRRSATTSGSAPIEQADVSSIITVDLNQRYQTIDGWETYLRMWEEDKINDRFDKSIERYTDLVANHLANNVGINRARLEVWSGLENPTDYWSAFYNGEIPYSEWKNYRYQKINDNDNPDAATADGFQFARFDYAVERMLLPLKRAVEEKGETLFINLCYVDFKWSDATLQGDISHANNAAEYAEFISVFLNRLKNKYGITADALEIILEPENTESWRGKQIGNAIVATVDRINAEGFYPEIIAPSTTAMNRAVPYLTEVNTVSGAIDRIDTFAYHRYGGESAANARSINQLAEEYGLKTAMLEKVGADVEKLFEDLTEANVTAWAQYGMAAISDESDENAGYAAGANYVVVNENANSGQQRVVNATKTTDLAQIFRFVRRGAQRVEVSTPDRSQQLLAFRNADGSVVLVVRSQNGGSTFGVDGLPSGEYLSEFVSTGSADIQLSGPLTLASGESQLVVDMPDSGIMTVYFKP